MVTGFEVGKDAGAAYVAAFAPEAATVPTEEFPPTIPFTSQTIDAPEETHRDAVKDCVEPSITLADDGAIELEAEHEMVTVAPAETAGFATLVAVTVIGFCAGLEGGAV